MNRWLPVSTKVWSVAIATAVALSAESWASPTSPERETLELSRRLKPIPDEQWNVIAGNHSSERYEIIAGDSLYTISKRLFGDGKYWPKIWALNNQAITNPHMLRPGHFVAFMPGSGNSLPSVAINPSGTLDSEPGAAPSTMATPVPEGIGASVAAKDWKNLPRQSWEHIQIQLPPDVDAQGFDHRSKITARTNSGFEIPMIATSDKVTPLGTITGSRSPGHFLSMGDTVFVSGQGDSLQLQLGESYSVVGEPTPLEASESNRSGTGYAYLILGQIKIIGLRDGVYTGVITRSKLTLSRGNLLIGLLPRTADYSPIPGPSAVEGTLIVEQTQSTFSSAQHKTVFVDRGTEDGIRPGMVFRSYQHNDPETDKKITDSDFLDVADILVIHSSEKFSTGLVIRSTLPIRANSSVVLLTDVSDLLPSRDGHAVKAPQGSQSSPAAPEESELDQLDRMDKTEGLGKEEEKELKQLERFQPPAPKPSAAPAPEPTPAPSLEPAPAPEPSPAAPTPKEETPPETAPPPPAPEADPTTPAPAPAPAPEETAPPPPPAEDSKGLDSLISQ